MGLLCFAFATYAFMYQDRERKARKKVEGIFNVSLWDQFDPSEDFCLV